MAVKRAKKKSKSKAAEAYEQTILAEGAPLALDLLGLGSTIGDLIRGKPRKAAKKKRRVEEEGAGQGQDVPDKAHQEGQEEIRPPDLAPPEIDRPAEFIPIRINDLAWAGPPSRSRRRLRSRVLLERAAGDAV